MASTATPRRRAGGQRRVLLLAIILILAGTFAVFHSQLLTGFTVLQVFPQDPLFQNWVLEHEWLWLTGAPLHSDFWSPPIFHPRPGALAFGDPMLGLLPFYAVARLAGGGPYLAYALAAIGALALTFAAHLWLYRAGFDLPARWAALAAFLVAYGAPRAAALNHAHLFAHYPSAVALLAFLRALDLRLAARERALWAAALPPLVAVQLYANVYLGALSALFFLFAATAALIDRDGRQGLVGLGRRGYLALASGVAAAAVLLLPLARGLAGSYGEIAGPPLAEIALYLPRPASWLNVGPESLLEPWLPAALGVLEASPVEWAHRLGIGLVTSALVAAGLVAAWRDRRLRWLAGGVAGLALVSLRVDALGSLWSGLLAVVDPLRSLRVVGRVGLVALALWGAALAHGVRNLSTRVRPPLLVLLLALVALEQVAIQPAFELAQRAERAREIAAAVPPDCDSFYYSSIRLRARPGGLPGLRENALHQVDAMWAALAARRPTLNGYSSHGPPDWPLAPLTSGGGAEDLADSRARLRAWIQHAGLDDQTVCWVRGSIRRREIESIEVERFVGSERR
jgi:hypothetical protein